MTQKLYVSFLIFSCRKWIIDIDCDFELIKDKSSTMTVLFEATSLGLGY